MKHILKFRPWTHLRRRFLSKSSFRLWETRKTLTFHPVINRDFPRYFATRFPPSIHSTTRAGPVVEFLVNQNPSELHHLIMVPGHGVTMTESLDGADRKDGDWFLLDYQKGKDVPQALITHMRAGLDELDSDQKALLLFSGEITLALEGSRLCNFAGVTV